MAPTPPPPPPAPEPPVIVREVGRRWRATEYAALAVVLGLLGLVPLASSQRAKAAAAIAPAGTIHFTSGGSPEQGGIVAAGFTASPDGLMRVDVVGAVTAPAVVELPIGSRVIDAIVAAGGATADADLTRLNKARLILDGESIVVPFRDEVFTESREDDDAPEELVIPKINLNKATREELMEIPGIGEVLSEAILGRRALLGHFERLSELNDVPGIGEKKLEEIGKYVYIE